MGILYDDDGPTPDEWTNMDLNRIAESIHRTRFVLVRNDDGTWSFGAPSMLSYSPRPGDMVPGETATAAMREWIEANAEDTAP
jgi:hypothetical protein